MMVSVPVQDRYVGSGSVQLFTRSLGSGRPLLAVHGGLGHEHRSLRPWLDALSAENEVVYVDLRGHGRSGGTDTLEQATHTTFVDDLDSVRRSLGLDRPILFGHSYGGFLALEYALRYPHHTGGLILCATSCSLAHAPAAVANAATRATPEVLNTLMGALSAPIGSDEDYARVWTTLAPLYFKDPDHPAIATFAELRYSARAFNRGTFGLLPSFDVGPRLHEIAAPTLVISGGDDWLMPPALAGEQLASGIAGAHHVTLATGHYPFIEDAPGFLRAVRRWMGHL